MSLIAQVGLGIAGTIILGIVVVFIFATIEFVEDIFSDLRNKNAPTDSKTKTMKEKFSISSDDFAAELMEMNSIAIEHHDRLYSRSVGYRYSLMVPMNALMFALSEFFKTAETQVNHSKKLSYETRYTAALKHMNELLGEDYYMSLVLNPECWHSSKKKRAQVVKALDKLTDQVKLEMKELNKENEMAFDGKIEYFLSADEANEDNRSSVDKFFDNREKENERSSVSVRSGLKSLLFKKNDRMIEASKDNNRSYDPREVKNFSTMELRR